MNRLISLFAALVITLGSTVAGQVAYVEPDTTIWFVTVSSGSEVYELEGHSGIAVYIKGQYPLIYHYGLYDFNRPNFVYHFVKGETDYMAGAWPADLFYEEYRRSGRRTIAQELQLDSRQKARLVDMLAENVKPQNATYRYNYVKDNCATRPLSVIQAAIGDSISFGPAPFESQALLTPTFRNVMRRYHRNYPWYQFGIDLALGSGIDYPLSRREMAFAPVELDDMLTEATVGDRPLFSGRRAVIVDVDEDNAVDDATPWYLTPLFICWLVFAISVYLTISDLRRRRLTRIFDALLYGIFGLAGCLLTFLIFISVHEATSPNWLYLWLNPLCLLVPLLLWWPRAWRFLRAYQVLNIIILVGGLCLWPFTGQSANAAFLPLVLADMLRGYAQVRLLRR